MSHLRAILLGCVPLLFIAGTSFAQGCGNGSLNGVYPFTASGFTMGIYDLHWHAPIPKPAAAVVVGGQRYTFDGQGNFTRVDYNVGNGIPAQHSVHPGQWVRLSHGPDRVRIQSTRNPKSPTTTICWSLSWQTHAGADVGSPTSPPQSRDAPLGLHRPNCRECERRYDHAASVSNCGTCRGARSGISTAYLMARQRPYSSALGSAPRALGILVIIRRGLRHGGGKRKTNGSADRSASHIARWPTRSSPHPRPNDQYGLPWWCSPHVSPGALVEGAVQTLVEHIPEERRGKLQRR